MGSRPAALHSELQGNQGLPIKWERLTFSQKYKGKKQKGDMNLSKDTLCPGDWEGGGVWYLELLAVRAGGPKLHPSALTLKQGMADV